MVTLKRPNKDNPYAVERHRDMIPAVDTDLTVIGTTVYIINEVNPQGTLLEHVIRDRVLAERRSGRVMGEDETLEQFRDYKLFLKNRLSKNLLLTIR